MLWFYSQDMMTVRIETRYDNRTAEYVLVVHWSDDHRNEERFATEVLFRNRVLAFEAQISAEGWKRNGPPIILPEGWPDTPPVH